MEYTVKQLAEPMAINDEDPALQVQPKVPRGLDSRLYSYSYLAETQNSEVPYFVCRNLC